MEPDSASREMEDKIKFLSGKKIVFLGMMPVKEINDFPENDFRFERNLLKMQLYMGRSTDLGRMGRFRTKMKLGNLRYYRAYAPDLKNTISSELRYSSELGRLRFKSGDAELEKKNLRAFIEENYGLYGPYSYAYLQDFLIFPDSSASERQQLNIDVKLKNSDADFYVLGFPEAERIISGNTVIAGMISAFALGLLPVDEKIRVSLRLYVYDRKLNLIHQNVYLEYKFAYSRITAWAESDMPILSEDSSEVFYSVLSRFTEDLYEVIQKQKGKGL